MVKEPEECHHLLYAGCDDRQKRYGHIQGFFIAIILFSSQTPASPEQELPQNVGAVCFGKINESSG
jgi:hypothetical protein